MPTTVYSQVLIHTVEWPGEGKLKTIAQGLTWQRKIQTCAIMLIHHMYACWIIYTKFNTDIFFYLNLLIQFLGSLLISKWFTSQDTSLFSICQVFQMSLTVFFSGLNCTVNAPRCVTWCKSCDTTMKFSLKKAERRLKYYMEERFLVRYIIY